MIDPLPVYLLTPPVCYPDGIAEEVNEKLQQVGEISIGALTTQYDLPSDFLEKVRS